MPHRSNDIRCSYKACRAAASCGWYAHNFSFSVSLGFGAVPADMNGWRFRCPKHKHYERPATTRNRTKLVYGQDKLKAEIAARALAEHKA